MRYSQISFLLGILAVSGLAAHAQSTTVPGSEQTFTTVDSFGNLVRSSADTRVAAPTGAMTTPGANSVSSDRRRRGRDSDDKIRTGTTVYMPGVPYVPYPYPYPYGAPVYNHHHYYPSQPTKTILGTPKFSWQTPVTITSIPLGTYYGGYPTYPAPGYPTHGYPAPGYGYPSPVYGHPSYPGVPYPAYGTTTTIYGNGGVYTQSQTGGYGFSFGNGGFSVQLGKQRSSTTTTVSRY